MKRVPEPQELMDGVPQAQAYAEADFSEANELFLDLFDHLHPDAFRGTVIDLGCGPADIPLRFACRHPEARIDAVDGSLPMITLARRAIETAGLEDRITTRCQHLPTRELPASAYGAVFSNSLLHHLNDPHDLWRTVRHCAAPGALVLVMDLIRPDSATNVDLLVRQYAADAPEILKRDFRASLHAAYTLEEVKAQLDRCGLEMLHVEQVSDRHLAIMGTLP